MIARHNNNIKFNGKFIYENKLSNKHKTYLNQLLSTQIKEHTNNELIKNKPFNVQIIANNQSKKTIHPRFTFIIDIPTTKEKNGYIGFIHINEKNNLLKNIKKISHFINNFEKQFNKTKELPKLTKSEEIKLQGKYLISNYFSKNPF